jgi:hypothetical protein
VSDRPRELSIRGVAGVGLALALVAFVLVRADPAALARSLRELSPAVVLGGLLLMLLRDVGADAGRWWLLLRGAGSRVPWRGLITLYTATVPAKALLPFKAGDGVRVVMLGQRYGVPLKVAAGTRIASAVLLLAAVAGAGLLAGAGISNGGLAGIALLVAAALAALGAAGKADLAGAAVCSIASVVVDITIYALVLASLGVELTSAVLAGCALVLGTSLMFGTLRGIGVREAALVSLAAASARPTEVALAVGLTLSALEVSAVVVQGLLGAAAGGLAVTRDEATPGPPSRPAAGRPVADPDAMEAAPTLAPSAPPSGTPPR